MDDTNKIIQDAYNQLEPAAKQALNKIPWKERVKGIANREKLNDDKASLLENETLMLLYNLSVPEEFAFNISEQLELGEDVSNRIAKEIFDEIVADVEKAYESGSSVSLDKLPEVLPNQPARVVPHVEVAQPKPVTPPAPPAPKPNLAPLPTYAEPSQMGPDEDKTKRPDLDFPQSGYSQGNDPYREPLL